MMSWWRKQTLRSKLAIWYALGGAALFSIFGTAIYYYVAIRIARPLDYHLRQDEAEIRSRLTFSPDGVPLWDGREKDSWDPSDPWFELWDENGRLVHRFWPLDESSITRLPSAPTPNRETISVFRVAEDIRLRVISVPFSVAGHKKNWMLRVMRLHRRSSEALGALSLIIAGSLPLIIFLLVFGGYRLTLHWLRPLENLVHATGKIRADNLAFRLPIANPHDEIGQLGAAFNQTLDRLDASYSALNRFVADASHELRTPLSALRAVGEVALSSDRTAPEYRDVIGSMLEEAQRLHRLVDRLLELARAEGGRQPVLQTVERVDVIAQECVDEMKLLAEEKTQLMTISSQPYRARLDTVLFRQSIRNLVENAIKYSPKNATIDVCVFHGADGTINVSVRDDGPGIAPAHRERVMDRFFRPDHSRTHERTGFGLGLAITRAYMQAMGGDLEFRPASPHGSVFTLKLSASAT